LVNDDSSIVYGLFSMQRRKPRRAYKIAPSNHFTHYNSVISKQSSRVVLKYLLYGGVFTSPGKATKRTALTVLSQ